MPKVQLLVQQQEALVAVDERRERSPGGAEPWQQRELAVDGGRVQLLLAPEAAPPPTLLVSAVVLDLASIIDRAADEAASAPTAEMASTLFSGVRLSFELFRGFASLQDCSRSPRLARLLANDCLFCARLAARVALIVSSHHRLISVATQSCGDPRSRLNGAVQPEHESEIRPLVALYERPRVGVAFS